MTWKSSGDKRTITYEYRPSGQIIAYLEDMRNAIRYATAKAYPIARSDNQIPSPIDLRREIKQWFSDNYDYAKHHVNPICRSAIAMLKSYRKNHHKLGMPQVKKLAMRIDAELFKIVDGKIRVTMRPHEYQYIPLNTRNKHYAEYSSGIPAQLLLTDKMVCITYAVSREEKKIGDEFAGTDLNFKTVDTTTVSGDGIEHVATEHVKKIVQIQNDFSRRKKKLQKHVKNPQKRDKKMRETRGRQRDRVNDQLNKTSTEQVKANPKASFVLEDLTGIRKNGENKSKKFRTDLNRWPYRKYQRMIEYKSPNRTIYVDPRGTSSECPVCGGRLKHPTWKISRCEKCGVDYERNRLSSLAIVLRGLHLCGSPFTVSADASWSSMKNEYLYARSLPEFPEADGTEKINAPNETSMHKDA